MTDKPHTPTTARVKDDYRRGRVWESGNGSEAYDKEFDRWLATVEAAAEQRGAVRALRHAQHIVAGFEHTIDEARERNIDKISVGYLIRTLDDKISDTQQGLADYLTNQEGENGS